MNRKTSLFEKPRTSAEMEGERSGKHRISKSVAGSESSGEISMRCRLCGEENEDMIHIFRIQKMIDYCLHIVVEKADTLPKRVCQICVLKLELFYQFTQIVNTVDQRFGASTERGTGEIEQPIKKNKETERQTPDETGLSSPVLTRSKTFAGAMVPTDTHCASSLIENRRRNSRNYELEQNHVSEYDANPRTSAEMEGERSGKHRISKSVAGSESSGEISMRCRLCGEENEDMIDIFRIQKMIDYCLYIVVQEADTLPKRVCQICFLKLELFYQFNQIVNTVDELFRASIEQGTGGIEQSITENKETEGQTPDETGSSSPVLTGSKTLAGAMVPTDTRCASSLIENRRRNSRNYELEQNDVSEYEANPGTSSAQQSISESTSDSDVSDIIYAEFKAEIRKMSGRQCEQKSEDVRIEQDNSAVPERPCDRKARFECNVCSKTYLSKGHLIGHKKLHSGKGLFTCSHCEKKFPFKSNRRRHYQSHMSRPLKYACKYCDKKLRSKQERNSHYRKLHKSKLPFECAICKKKCMYLSELQRHAVAHSDERNHHCDLCEKSFKFSQGRDRHMMTSHASRERFVCEHCKTKCQGKYSLWQHLKMCEKRNPEKT